jgi:hypothetical protein
VAIGLFSLACSMLLALLLGPTEAGAADATSASVQKPAKVKKKGRVVVFDLSGTVDSGTLKLGNKKKPLGSKTLSRAERRGELKTKLPGRWLSRVAKPKRGKLARKTRLEVTVGGDAPVVGDEGGTGERPPEGAPPESPVPDDPPVDPPPPDDSPVDPTPTDDPPVEPPPPDDPPVNPAPTDDPPVEPPPPDDPPVDPPPPDDPPVEPPPDDVPPAEGLRVGLVTNAQGHDMSSSTVLDKAEPTGAKWLREDFDWNAIEPQDDAWSWSRYDNLLIEAAKRDVRILPVLMGTPSWAGSAWNEIPANPAEYAEYTAKVVERYGPGGSFWQANPDIATFAPEYFELWNEPYLDEFSAGNVDPGRYARLVKAAASAGHSSNSQARYLLAAEQAPSGERHTFIDGMYSAVPDLNSYFDAVAVHPYSGSSSPDDPRDGWGFSRLADVRAKFVDHGAQDKPLWITEIGWSTCPQDTRYCTSEQNQAAYLARMFELLGTTYSGYVRAAFVYCRTDLNDHPAEAYGWYGLQRLDGSHKPAYDVFRQAAGGA